MPITVTVPGRGDIEFPDDTSEQTITGVIRREELLSERERINNEAPSSTAVFLNEFGSELASNLDQAGIGITQGFAQIGAGANKLMELAIQGLGKRDSPNRQALLEQFRGASEIARDASGELEQLGKETPGATLTRRIASGMTQSTPSIIAAPFGLAAAASTAAVQGFGTAQVENEAFFQSQGDSPETARSKAFIPSVASGAITGLVTAGFGRTGIEALGAAAVTGGLRNIVGNILHQSGMEATEEFVDEVGQISLEMMALHKDMSADEILSRAMTAAASGLIAGGMVTAAASAGATTPALDMEVVFPNAPLTSAAVAESASTLKDAPVRFIGNMMGLDVYNLTETLNKDLVKDSTVSEEGLAKHGFKIPDSARLAIVPPPIAKINEIVRANDLIDGERIKAAVGRKDVLPGRDWIASPEFEFRFDPIAGSLVVAAVEAELSYGAQAEHDVQRFDSLSKEIDEAGQRKVTDALFEFEKTGDLDAALNKLPIEHQPVFLEVRNYFDQIRNLVINDKVQSIETSLSAKELETVRLIEGGMSEEAAFSNVDLTPLQQATIRESVADLAKARKWGIENYITHIERGHLRLVTPDGGTIMKASTTAEAAILADQWLASHPDTESLTITDEFDLGVDMPTKLTKGQYFRFLSRAADELNQDADTIQRILTQAGRVVAIKPTNKFAGPMVERKDVLEGESNVFDILPAYAYSMRKKLALDPVMRQARNVFPKMAPESRQQIEELLNDIRGRKYLADKVLDYILTPKGRESTIGKIVDRGLLLASFKPFGVSRGVAISRQIVSIGKLGWRPVAVAVNRVSGAMHTWVKTGTESFIEGRKFIKTPEGQEILKRNEPFIGVEAAFGTEGANAAPWWHPLGLFQAMERINRPEAFGAFYVHATSKLGMDGPTAEKWARAATRFAQFTYNTGSLPRIMRGPVGKLVFQFKPYLLKELEYISTLRGAEIPRYMSAFIATGGPRAALYTLMSLPFLGAFGLLDDLEDWLNRNLPRASRGVPGFLGVDVSPSVAFQFPQTGSDIAGPFLSDAWKLWDGVLKPMVRGESRDWNDVQDWASRLAPAIYWWDQAIESLSSDSGWTTDKYGKMEYKPTGLDTLKMMMGAKPLEKSMLEVERRYLTETEEIQRNERQRAIEAYLDADAENDGVALDEIGNTLADMGVTVDQVKAAAKRRGTEPRDRLLKSLTKKRRAEEIERFEEPNSPPVP